MNLVWETLTSTWQGGDKIPDSQSYIQVYRAKVPGGWLVWAEDRNRHCYDSSGSITFMPDPEHRWDGNSLP